MASTCTNLDKLFCCIPHCKTDTWRNADPFVTFHPFPAIPKMATKWIRQINSALIHKSQPMWFPRANSVVCSKHFQPADLNTGKLKPQAIPTIFSNNLMDVDEILSDLQASSAEDTELPSIDNKIGPAVPERAVEISGRTVKPYAIKDILDRASVLFARSMAITKCLEDTRPIPTNENECSESEVPDISLHSSPELNLDKALSLAALQAKWENHNKKSEQKIVVPSKITRPTSKFGAKTPDCIPGDSVGNKTSVAPNTSSQTSSKIQKRQHEDGSYTELIKIAPNKFLKIQRLSGKESIPSANTSLISVPSKKPENSQSEDVIMDSNVDDPCGSSNDHDPPLTPETDKVCNATIKTPTQGVLNKQTALFSTNEPPDRLSIRKLASSIRRNKRRRKKVKPASLKKSKKLNKNSPGPSKGSVIQSPSEATDTITVYNPARKSTTIISAPNNKLGSLIPCDPSKNLLLEKKNALLKQKIEELEKKCFVQQRKLMEPMQKKLEFIQEKSSKGDASATYILEQINTFGSVSKMHRWSDSTLLQCALLCRKGAYAYEMFRKVDFFRLPSFTTVERYIRKNPNLTLPRDANNTLPASDKTNKAEKNNSPSARGIVYNKPNNWTVLIENHTNRSKSHVTSISKNKVQNHETAELSEPPTEIAAVPVTVDSSSPELREIVLETGEVIQCYSNNICTGADGYQYYIIPNDNSNNDEGHDIQNSENAQVLPEQEQIVYIDNSSHQLHSSEAEVATAVVNITRTESH